MIHPMTFTFQSRIGLGTWQMGEAARSESDEVKAIEAAIQMGYRLIDTAEMYASGNAESLIGKALKIAGHSKRDQLQIVSKVLPSNASTKGTVAACEASIKRMSCDYIDCYLLHWQGSHSYEATIEGFLKLHERGLIRSYGISNFDTLDLQKWIAAENRIGAHERAVCNQVYYALNARGIEHDLMPLMQKQTMQLMAYSPLGTGGLVRHPNVKAIADTLGITPAQLALTWILRQPNTVAIPKTVNVKRLEENLSAGEIVLGAAVLRELDRVFPPPRIKTALHII
jgi:diketogulonate reductase-like aldo/keto reductase